MLGSNFFHVLQVHNKRAMHAQELLWIESLLEVGHSFAQQMCFPLRGQTNVILFRSDPANFRNRKKEDAAPRLENNASGISALPGLAVDSRGILCGCKAFAYPLYGRHQALGGEGVAQVI